MSGSGNKSTANKLKDVFCNKNKHPMQWN